jgi:hypothetical protein
MRWAALAEPPPIPPQQAAAKPIAWRRLILVEVVLQVLNL